MKKTPLYLYLCELHNYRLQEHTINYTIRYRSTGYRCTQVCTHIGFRVLGVVFIEMHYCKVANNLF